MSCVTGMKVEIIEPTKDFRQGGINYTIYAASSGHEYVLLTDDNGYWRWLHLYSTKPTYTRDGHPIPSATQTEESQKGAISH